MYMLHAWLFVLEAGSYVAQAKSKLFMLNSGFFCLCILGAGIAIVSHHI